MRHWLALGILSLPAVALAEDGGTTSRPPSTSETSQAIIGGTAAPAGKWPDAVAVMWNGGQGCTGTLVAPTVVVTAGHCVPDNDPPTEVLVGASALSRPQEGQMIPVTKSVEYPDSWNTIDAGILILSQPATMAPRPIATGWVKFDIKNGASVQLVGFGTTDRDGSRPTDALMEAATTITDFNCAQSSGCNDAARPDGEMAAGGRGIDTCPGDSGGPVYLTTPYGAFLTGITSRAFDDASFACSEGGIYGRPDKIMDWIEAQAGVKLARGPAPSAELITVVGGDPGETQVMHNDPKPGTKHAFAITTPPMHVQAAVRDDGRVRVCGKRGVVGGDEFVVTVTDKADPTRALTTKVNVLMQEGDGADDCDPMAFGDEGGGCCDTRRSASGSIPLALAVLLVLRRRRK